MELNPQKYCFLWISSSADYKINHNFSNRCVFSKVFFQHLVEHSYIIEREID